jgi:hypothetical protein
MIEKEIEAIFAGQDVGDGDVDIDGVLAAFERLRSLATKADLPCLVAALQSPRNNFWTRELFADPVSRLGGADYLEPLLEALKRGSEDGHDNDGLCTYLAEIARADSNQCRKKLEQLLARDDFQNGDEAKWLLGFCRTG